jgi:hypothetical protein
MPLLQFLNSSLNVELVYIILKSITEFSKLDLHGDAENLEFRTTLAQDFDVVLDQETGDATLKFS